MTHKPTLKSAFSVLHSLTAFALHRMPSLSLEMLHKQAAYDLASRFN
ncbi:hypothetical protein OYT1_ch2647 [Ferriphaselus amnicola]|uniref:Uncharacterized protein n=1 Tax=Ferriphaselus amnicola TaxID=1188319 RepID=A0A2Z6GFH3_9PROT|nr:hypothetical protein OYT1_ch2647 [Ferriphaselus amnicola]